MVDPLADENPPGGRFAEDGGDIGAVGGHGFGRGGGGQERGV
jgi:hypothetical protein